MMIFQSLGCVCPLVNFGSYLRLGVCGCCRLFSRNSGRSILKEKCAFVFLHEVLHSPVFRDSLMIFVLWVMIRLGL